MTIQQLPTELLCTILEFIPSLELLSKASVCKFWNNRIEEIVNRLLLREFRQKLDETSKPFQMYTGRNVYEFLPELSDVLKMNTLKTYDLNEKLKSFLLRMDIHKTSCIMYQLDGMDSEKIKEKFQIEIPVGSKFLHLQFSSRNDSQYAALNPQDPLQDELTRIYHFPIELFPIKENEETAFPFKGRLMILRAKQVKLFWLKNKKPLDYHSKNFQEVNLKKNTRRFRPNIMTLYLWPKDAAPSMLRD